MHVPIFKKDGVLLVNINEEPYYSASEITDNIEKAYELVELIRMARIIGLDK